MGGPVSNVVTTRLRRARPVAHRTHTLSPRNHGLPLAVVAGRDGRADERGTVGWNRNGQQLDRLCGPSSAGPDAGGPTDGGHGQAQLETAHRSVDRGLRDPAGTGERSAPPTRAIRCSPKSSPAVFWS